MADTEHKLADITIYEAILEAAESRLDAVAGVDLPYLSAFAIDTSDDTETREGDRVRAQRIAISFEDIIYDQPLSGEFQISENILKGIAMGRQEDLETFMAALMLTYRPGYIEATLRHELHEIDSEEWQDQRLIAASEAYNVFRGFGTAPWCITSVSVFGLAPDLFRVELLFEDEEFDRRLKQELQTGRGVDGDLTCLPISVTWDEFNSATKTAAGLTEWLKRINQEFVVRKDDLKRFYSRHAKWMIAAEEAEKG